MSGTTLTAAQTQQANIAKAVAANAVARQDLITNGVRMRANLGIFGPFTAGQRASIKMRNVGVMTGIFVRVTGNVSITAAATASPWGPDNLLSKVEFQDYNTTLRVSTNATLLKVLLGLRHGRTWLGTGQGSVDTQQTVQPTGVANNQLFQFSTYIPLAVDPHRDLSGAVPAQTVVGEQFLNLTVNPNVVGDVSSPYTAGTMTLNSVSFQVWQDYILPATPTSPLPYIDLNTVYELQGNFSTSQNVASNGQAFIDYPNVRSVRGLLFALNDNGTAPANGTDIVSLTQLANGNTNLREDDPLSVRAIMRSILGGDAPPSIYYIGNRTNPIATYVYSQVQERVTFGTLAGASSLLYMTESMYGLNTPLPGIASAS